MPSSFPGAIDSFVDPLSTSPLSSPSHALQHQNINDAVEKVEQYMGLVKVIPTSATNGTVGATGTVTIGNAVSSVTVVNAFSTLYDSYKIIINGGVGSSNNDMRLQLGATVTGYYSGANWVTYANAQAFNGVANASSFVHFGTYNTNTLGANCDLLNPFLSSPTLIWGMTVDPTVTGRAGSYSGYLANTTSYTDFTITLGGGTITGGSIKIYGYRK